MDCAITDCVAEVVAVKDVFLQDPKPLFEEFIKTDERGEDTYIGWLYLLRDSVLLNPNHASVEERTAMQQAIVAKAKEYESDPKYGDWAKSILTELELLDIAGGSTTTGEGELGVTGTYAYELPNEAGSGELEVLDNGDNTIRYNLMVVGHAPAYNQGFMEGTAPLNGGVATITTTEYGGKCTITLTFTEDKIIAKTLYGSSAECGFGNNVYADGTYDRTNDINPFPAVAGDEMPAEMEGVWVSSTDEKSEVVIGGSRYTEVYDSEAGPKTPFSYHKVCPKDCNPIGGMPCLKLYGQDDICYTVVKADGKTLELSMIGGTGNTLVYKLKE